MHQVINAMHQHCYLIIVVQYFICQNIEAVQTMTPYATPALKVFTEWPALLQFFPYQTREAQAVIHIAALRRAATEKDNVHFRLWQ